MDIEVLKLQKRFEAFNALDIRAVIAINEYYIRNQRRSGNVFENAVTKVLILYAIDRGLKIQVLAA